MVKDLKNCPKISIVTPSLNQAKFLPYAIESVLSQEYPNIEYIIIDGGSTDGSIDIIRQYESCLSFWSSEKDGGQSEAINKGFQKATGDIVAWLNSDDLYLPGVVNKAAEHFTSDPQLDLLYGDCVFIDEDGHFIRYFTECEPYNSKRIRNYSDFIMQPTTFFRRKTLQKIGFLRTSLNFTMDWDLWARFARAGAKVIYIPQVLAANREYPHTKTNSGGIRRLHEILLTNMRNMTGWWPNAFFSFTAYELYQRCQNIHPFLRFYGSMIAQFISLLSMNRFFCPRPRPLYGIFPHSSMCLENPEFILPSYGPQKPDFIRIIARIPAGKKAVAEVDVNDVTIFDEAISQSTSLQLDIPIRSAVRNTNCYRIAPRFYIDNQIVRSNIYSIKLLRSK
jgi:glycosyltransferase involved in cell wall biosynthesis